VILRELPLRFLSLLLCRAANVVHRILFRTPFDPYQLSMCIFCRPMLLETRSQKGLMANSLRILGRDPLLSASRFLGFILDL
jgi:hypothetical protein